MAICMLANITDKLLEADDTYDDMICMHVLQDANICIIIVPYPRSSYVHFAARTLY